MRTEHIATQLCYVIILRKIGLMHDDTQVYVCVCGCVRGRVCVMNDHSVE